MQLKQIPDFIPAIALISIGAIYWQYHNKNLVSTRLNNHTLSQNAITVTNTNNFPTCDVVPGSVHDGDTIKVNCAGKTEKIRFACIDAPELAQTFGQESRDYLRSLLNQANNQVKVQPVTTDKYGRTVAQLWITRSIGESLLQSEMVSAGMAYPYERYAKDCPNWDAVTTVQARALSERVGVYGQPDLEKPWDYRKNK